MSKPLTSGGSIAELAALLVQKLTAADFARVCEILTSPGITGAGLAEELERQFKRGEAGGGDKPRVERE